MSFSKPRSLFSVKFLWLKHQLSATFLLILPPLKHHSDRCPNFCWHYQINFNFRKDERQEKKYKISIKSEQNYFNFRRRKKLSCQSVFFLPMSTPGSSRCASFKSNSWWELRRTLAADVASAWNPMGGGDGGRCTVKRRRRQIRSQKWPGWPIFQQHSSNIYFATNIKTLLNDHE